MKLKIEITLDNAVFANGWQFEAERILKRAAEQLHFEVNAPGDWFTLRDLNGNAVGKVKVTR